MKPPTAFLSHSSADQATAQHLTQRLRNEGIEVWIDTEQIGLGESIPARISAGLQETDIILVLVSESFVRSSWCRAEYEPLLIREIEDDRTWVVPLILDDTPMPPLLATKRYLDLRSPHQVDLDELAWTIRRAHSVKEISRMVSTSPPTFEGSALGLIIGSILDDFPVARLSDQDRLSGNSLVDLYRAVERLVEQYQRLCDELLRVLHPSRLSDELSWDGWVEVEPINRKLIALAADMREIATHIGTMLSNGSMLRERLRRVSQLCVAVADMEGMFLYLTLGLPSDVPPDLERIHFVGLPVPDAPGTYEPAESIEGITGVRAKLDGYVRELRSAIAEALIEPPNDRT